MKIQYYISAILLAFFIALIIGRAAVMRRKGIKAIMFGATDKSDFLLVPCVLLIIYTVFADTFGLPLAKAFAEPVWNMELSGWVGIFLCVIAVIGIGASLISFGNSFRVGIDEVKSDKLVTTGVFRFSRNPIYVCFDTFFIGLTLIHRNIAMIAAIIFFVLIIHRQILREEKFLKHNYGREYEDYCRKVRRYL